MFDVVSILIIAGAILASIWLLLLIARVLLSAFLLSIHHAANRRVDAVGISPSPRQILKTTTSVRKSQNDSRRR